MTVLANGHGITPQYILGSPAMAAPAPIVGATSSGTTVVADGTPVRVVVLAFAAAAGLVALKMAGFRFNVGVSN